MFRVNEEGFRNRYRNNLSNVPHTDSAYRVMYPSNDNGSYTCEETRNNRRSNVRLSRYYAKQVVNGTIRHSASPRRRVPHIF